jgi:uncharacterized protein (TIGR02001 family)
MRIILGCISSVIALAAATPAFAEDEAKSAFTINGSASVVSDYRFRGVSQTDKNAAIQGSITVSHESGLYASVWGSSVSGYVVAGATATVELDLIAGWKKTFSSGTTVDVGVLYYYYPRTKLPGDTSSSDFVEPYLAVSQAIGPVTAKGTLAWAPSQKGLRLDQTTGPNRSNVYLAGDLSASIPGTPIGLSAHVGHSFGPSWLASDALGKREYTDWSLGATLTHKALTLGVSYVDTDATFVSFTGKNVSKGGIVLSLGASF